MSLLKVSVVWAFLTVICLFSQSTAQTNKKIMELIMWSDTDDVARILSESDNIQDLAQGFRFPESQRSDALAKSAGRREDGDVVALQAIARSALDTGDTFKLAQVMWLAIYPFGGSTLQEAVKLQKDLQNDLANTTLMEQIYSADPTTQFVPATSRGRRLTCNSCSPVNSWICAHCWPDKVCKKYFWCRSAGKE